MGVSRFQYEGLSTRFNVAYGANVNALGSWRPILNIDIGPLLSVEFRINRIFGTYEEAKAFSKDIYGILMVEVDDNTPYSSMFEIIAEQLKEKVNYK